MSVYFKAPCHTVQSEINLRLTEPTWVDPHNNGNYSKVSSQEGLTKGSRVTGDGKYTDLFNFNFKSMSGGEECEVTACSESQVFSVLDFSTNYCNLRNLYCNSDDGCVPLNSDLTYYELYTSCMQRKKESCIVAEKKKWGVFYPNFCHPIALTDGAS